MFCFVHLGGGAGAIQTANIFEAFYTSMNKHRSQTLKIRTDLSVCGVFNNNIQFAYCLNVAFQVLQSQGKEKHTYSKVICHLGPL